MSSIIGGDGSDVEGKATEKQQEPSGKEEDEEVEVVTVDTTSVEMLELADPTILRMGTAICSTNTARFRYSKEELLKLKESPLSLKRPDCLDTAYDNNNGIWDPERWHFDRKSSETSTENGNKGNDSDSHRRRSGDPRDRIRKEHDGIVLSPQRRSFTTGCCVPVRDPAKSNRSHSPLGGKGEAPPHHIGHREISQGPAPRRIGSGRIFFDYSEKTEPNNEFVYRRERRDTDRERDERYDRRSFGRETEPPSTRPKSKESSFTRNGARYDRRRISNDSQEEEPEWFSEGPSSQHDTIELRGFDESEKVAGLIGSGGKKRMTTAQKKKAKERAANIKNAENQSSIGQPTVKEETTKAEGPGARSTPTPLVGNHAETAEQSSIADKGAAGDASEGENQRKTQHAEVVEESLFTIEDMLKADSIPMLLPNGVGLESGDSSGSKFSRWFSRERSPPNSKPQTAPPDGSRRPSVPDDHHHLIKNILNDISEPATVSIPTESESYFAPISPAASTGGVAANPGIPQAASQPFSIMEMLQRGNKHQGGPLHADLPPAMKNIEVPGKLLCVEELETRIRQGDSVGEIGANIRMNTTKPHNKAKEDNSAFQKLLAQMQDGQVIPASNGPIPQKAQPMSIMEMLSHSQKQEEAARLAQMRNSTQAQMANDLSYKMQHSQAQQRQIEAFTKLLASGVQQARTPPPLTDIGLAGRELLNRPEAQAILQGLKRGDITPQHLYQQLANPALQSRHRELLQMILKLQGPNVGPPASRVLSPVPPHPMFQQQQQLRVSPLPPNAYCVSPILATSPNTLTVPAMHQRIPSPRELQVHTQTIMQRALIKKKLEEQQENYRKKQELQQRGQSPGGISPAKNVASPTQLAFTPTAVLRKMTAEKEDGTKDSLKSGDAQVKAQHQGRAVTGMRNQQNQQQTSSQPSQGQQSSQTPQGQSQQSQGQQQQAQQQQWSAQFQQQMNKQPAGRPIVKNNANFQQTAAQQQQYDQFIFQQQQQQRLISQQQHNKQSQFGGGMPGQYAGMQYSNNPQQQYMQHQLRAQHQQQQQHHVRGQHQQQQQQHGLNQQWQQIMQHNPNFDTRQVGRGTGNDGDMSPTSNQLARWFSPDLLERARKGKLPNMPASGRAQHAMSLEEIERQSAPVIHN